MPPPLPPYLQEHNGKTAYDIACLSNNYESARLLRSLHWAHKKDVLQNNKLRSEQLSQKRETEHKAIQVRLLSRRAETAYNNWLEKKHFSDTLEPPRECEKRKESIASPYLHSAVCATCSNSSKQCRIPTHQNDRRASMSIKMSHHQEGRNLESVGKPDMLQPYTNVSLKSKKLPGKGSTGSASASGRGSRATSIPMGVKFYTKRVKLSVKGDGNRKKSKGDAESLSKTIGDIETVVSSVPDPALGILQQFETSDGINPMTTAVDALDSDKQSDNSGTESDELDFSKLNDVDLAYPQYDFDIEDDSSLFHDVGDFNNLESLSLPTVMTKDKTPAEILQLLRKLGSPGSGKRTYRRSNSYSYSSKQASSAVGRRLSLGSIPEGKIVTDYKEGEEEDNDIDSQFFRNLENTIRGIGSSDEEGKEDRSRSPSPLGEPHSSGRASSDEGSITDSAHTDYSLSPSPMVSSSEADTHDHEEETVVAAKPPKTLKILNFAWDPSSNLVHTEVSSMPITSQERKHPLKLTMQPDTFQPPHSLPTLEVTPPASLHTPSEAAPSIMRKITPPLRKVIPTRKITPPPDAPSYHEILSHEVSGDPMPQVYEVAPPSDDIVVMLRRITPPSRKVTPPSWRPPPRKVTPPSRPARKITPPPHEFHVTSHDSGESLSSLAMRPLSPEVGGATTPPLNSPLQPLPFHLSLSEPCITPGQQGGEEFYTETAPANFSTPLFYLEESEEEEEVWFYKLEPLNNMSQIFSFVGRLAGG